MKSTLTALCSSVNIPLMLKIRLQRVGRKHEPVFRLVLTDSKNSTKSGRFLEILGSYDSRRPAKDFKAERITYWISKGAQVSGTVHNMFIDLKIIKGEKLNVLPRKSPIVKEEVKDEKAVPAAVAEAPQEEKKEAAPKESAETVALEGK